ncbi:MAG: metabolite traffic protein EboE [Planctomycetes bacterium]|nr:metabolite traffic protein EboE [Planctomycetota bacterium]
MRFTHPQHGTRSVRLAYCTNLHAGESLEEIRDGLQRVSLAVKRELGVRGPFGVGLYLPAKVALALACETGRADLDAFARWLEEAELDAFTFNAFPYGEFQRDGLKEAVYRPTWDTQERAQYTQAVAHVARRLVSWAGDPTRHISISTHPGAHVSQVRGGTLAHLEGMARAVVDLVRTDGPPIVLSVEAEPWAIAGDSATLADQLARVAELAQGELVRLGFGSTQSVARAVSRLLGTCLDACHSAVEFEAPEDAVELARQVGPMGKLQYSNALRVQQPASNAAAVAALLELDEPRFLHQVRGRSGDGFEGAADLADLARELDRNEKRAAWLACDEWRCHFHVPVNLPRFEGLGTTREHADAILLDLLEDPDAWRTY